MTKNLSMKDPPTKLFQRLRGGAGDCNGANCVEAHSFDHNNDLMLSSKKKSDSGAPQTEKGTLKRDEMSLDDPTH